MRFIKILLGVTLLFITEINSAQSLTEENSHFGVFAAYVTEYPYFISQMEFSDAQYWDWVRGHLSNLGAHWTRSNNELIWDYIEPVLDSTYNWNPEPFKTDSMIVNTYNKNYPVNWLGVFKVGSLFGQRPDRPPLRNPLSDTLRYLRFVRNAVERYDGDGNSDVHPDVCVKYWQLGNEMPGNATLEMKDDYVR